MNGEIWKSIPGYEDYEASESAEIRKRNENGSFTTIKPSRTTDDYFTVRVRDDEGDLSSVHYT